MSYQEERLQEIADAIREVKGTTEEIPATDFASEIAGLSVVKPSGIKTITENGDYDVTDYAWASVNVEPNLQEKTVTVNGEVVADSGYDGLSKVTVDVPSEEPTLITKEITENGTYKASDDGADGYSEVVVNVASSGGDATPKIYGVSWVNDASTTMTRTDDAVGMSYSINTSTGKITSDFDNVFPYNQMKRTVIDGNTFVFVPAMWFRVITDADKKITSIAVSSVKGEGDDWYPTRPFYYGAYGASSDGTVLKSVSGANRLRNITRATARTRAMAVGEKYHQRDLYSGTILMFLWWIEFATKNSQSVMPGGGGAYSITGNTDNYYNEEEGDSFCVSLSPPYNNALWHGIEDYIGVCFEWEDGITSDGIAGGKVYVSDDYTLYDEYSDGSKMSEVSLTPTTGYGCLEALGWDKSKPFLCIPTMSSANTYYSSGFCDGSWLDSGIQYSRGSSGSKEAYQGVSHYRGESASWKSSSEGCRLVKEV